MRLAAEHQMQLDRADAGEWWVVESGGPSCAAVLPCMPHTTIGPDRSALPAVRREEQSRQQQVGADYERRLAEARGEWEAQRAALVLQHAREMEGVKQQHASNQVRCGRSCV